MEGWVVGKGQVCPGGASFFFVFLVASRLGRGVGVRSFCPVGIISLFSWSFCFLLPLFGPVESSDMSVPERGEWGLPETRISA